MTPITPSRWHVREFTRVWTSGGGRGRIGGWPPGCAPSSRASPQVVHPGCGTTSFWPGGAGVMSRSVFDSPQVGPTASTSATGRPNETAPPTDVPSFRRPRGMALARKRPRPHLVNGALRMSDQRWASCLIRLVSSVTWLNRLRRSPIRFLILRSACITVVWSLPPNC